MSNVVPLGRRNLDTQTVTESALNKASEFWAKLAKTGDRRVSLGFPKWENLTRPKPYQYVVIAARPGMYKTTLAWTWAINLAQQGKRVLWVGMDMPGSEMVGWAISRLSGVSFRDLEAHGTNVAPLSSSSRLLVSSVTQGLESLPLVIWSKSTITVQEFHHTANLLPYDAVFIDYVQQIQSQYRTEPERISAASSAVRRLATDRPCYVVALAQMNREIERPVNGKPRLPQLSDLAGSRQLEADADVVAFMHRPTFGPERDNTEVQLVIRKNRNGPCDALCELKASPETKFIEEVP